MNFVKKLFFFISLLPAILLADTYPEVIFDNSIVRGAYAKSKVLYTGDSWVENVNKHLLVSDTLFFTPGNSLSLKYLSSKGGFWETSVNYSRQKYNYTVDDSDVLSIRINIKSTNTTLKDLPKLFIRHQHYASDTLSLEKFITAIEYNKWIHLKIPVKNFRITNKQAPILGIGFAQHTASTLYHHIFIDQIEFLPIKYSEIPLQSAAILSEAKGYDKAVHLSWQLPLTPSIRYIKIYRSEDGKEFQPVSIRPIHMQSCLDIVPLIGQKYYYKVTWMDFNYKESPASTVKEVETKPMKDEEIIRLVQLANVNYFVENFDINSGMYMPFRSKNKVIVSTKETAGAILSLVVGVKNDFVKRQTALNRISKIAFFLLKSQTKNGIFPAYYDARKGVPEYRSDKAIYDVQATGSIIEALLIAREFFNENNETENDLRKRITQIYQQVDWSSLLDNNDLLKSKLALLEENDSKNVPLSGLENAINTYLLAIGESKFAITSSTYFNAVYSKFETIKQDTTQSINPYFYNETITEDEFHALKTTHKVDTTVQISVLNSHVAYGLDLPFGKLNRSLLDLYEPFLTIRPEIINDSLTNWGKALQNYLHYVKRRDNEIGLGASNSDIWGFYKSNDSVSGYRINPAIGPSSISIDKSIGTKSIISLYKQYGNILFTEYGFRSWLDLQNDDVSDEYNSANQAAIAVMIENAKTGLIWDLYDKIPELKSKREALFRNKK